VADVKCEYGRWQWKSKDSRGGDNINMAIYGSKWQCWDKYVYK
jgi:hypothetical protein